MEPRLDPRIRRTRRALHDSLLVLLEEQELSSIQVQEIVGAADVNRATFYLHYSSKEDLAHQALDELFEGLVGEIRSFVDAHRSLAPDAPPEAFVDVFRRMRERPKLYLRLLSDVAPESFGARLNAFFEEETLRHWPDLQVRIADGEAPVAFRARFVSSATLGIMIWWLRNGAKETPEMVTAWLWDLLHPIWFREESPTDSTTPGTSR